MYRLVQREIANLSLGTRITVGVLLLFACGTVLQIYLLGASERARALEAWQGSLVSRSDFKLTQFQGSVDHLRRNVLFLSKLPAVPAIIRTTVNRGKDPVDNTPLALWNQRLEDILLAFVNANPEYYKIRLIGLRNGGQELMRVDRRGELAHPTPLDQLQRQEHSSYVKATLGLKEGEVYLSEVSLNWEFGKVEVPHKRTLRAVTPVFTASGDMFGLVVINMDVGPALADLSRGLGSNVRVYLTNQEGDYLAHPDSSRTFGFDLGTPHRWQTDLDASPESTRQARPTDTDPQLQDITLSGEALHVFSRKLYFDPQQPSRHMTLALAVRDEFINSNILRIRTTTLASAGVIALVVALMLFLYLRRVLQPLQQLRLAAVEIGNGNYWPNLPGGATGEIGTLTVAFQGMLDRISLREQEIKHSNASLAASEAFANLVVDTVPQGIVVVDANGLITRANERLEQLFGHTPDALIGKPIELLIPERFGARHIDLRNSYADAPSHRTMGKGRDLFGLHISGSEFPVEVGLAPLEIGGKWHVVVSIADISKRKEAEQLQIQYSDQLKRINEELNNFAYAASHDLKSPLRGIDQLATWLKEDSGDTLNADAREHLRLMHSRIHRMERLLDDLLAYSRIGRSEHELLSVNTRELVLEVFDLLASTRAIKLIVDDNLPTLQTRKVPLELVFRNLISNAIKHHHKPQGTIHVSARQTANEVEFVVQDDGPGISAEHQAKVFGMFQTLKPRDEVEGSGIGLALVKKAVESTGGTITLESDGKNGCTFRFTWVDAKQIEP